MKLGPVEAALSPNDRPATVRGKRKCSHITTGNSNDLVLVIGWRREAIIALSSLTQRKGNDKGGDERHERAIKIAVEEKNRSKKGDRAVDKKKQDGERW